MRPQVRQQVKAGFRHTRQVRRNKEKTPRFRGFAACYRQLVLEWLEPRQLLAAFTPGNLVALRVGVLGGTLTNAATAAFLDELDADGQIVQSIPLPTTASGNQRRLTISGSGIAEGLLTRSVDGRYLLVAGYDAAVGTSAVVNTASSTVNRVVGRVDALGRVDTSTVIADAYGGSGGGIRSAASVDGRMIWTTGGPSSGSGGLRVLAFGNTGSTTPVASNVTDLRAVQIFNDQLYVSANPTSGVRLGRVSGGLPTSGGQTISSLPGIASGGPPTQPYQFFAADLRGDVPGIDTLYVADDSTSGGIRKFSLVGGNWVLNSSLPLGGQGARGLTGKVEGGTVTLFASTSASSNNPIYKVVDPSGWNAAIPFGAASVLQGGIPGAAFRGLAFAPPAYDYGDAPASYGTLQASGGPGHIATGPRLGEFRDVEADGQPTPDAAGDDQDDVDDEDGVLWLTPLVVSPAGEPALVRVTASQAARLDAWIDFNRNGQFDDPAERITAPGGTLLAAGANTLSFVVPPSSQSGPSFARFRLSTAGGLAPTGLAADGEVEDHPVVLQAGLNPNPTLNLPPGGGVFLLDRTGDTVRLTQGTTVLFSAPQGAIQSLRVQGSNASETLVVDYAGGDPLPEGGLEFHAGGASTVLGNTLVLRGSGTQTVVYQPDGTFNPALERDGTLWVDGRRIDFTRLAPLDIVGAQSVTIQMPGADDTLLLEEGTTFGPETRAAWVLSGDSDGVPIETVALAGNATVVVDTTLVDGHDRLTLRSGANAHGNGRLELRTGGGNDAVEVHGRLVVSQDLIVTSQNIHFPLAGSLLEAGGTIVLDAGSGAISTASPTSVSVRAPAIGMAASSTITLGIQAQQLAAASGGELQLRNLATAPLVVGLVGTLSGLAATASGGTVQLTSQGPLIVSTEITAGGNVQLTARETASLDNDVHLLSGAAIRAAGSVTIEAGDAVQLAAGSRILAGSPIQLKSLDLTVDDGGTTFEVAGDLDAPEAILFGSGESDLFSVRPDMAGPLPGNVATPIRIEGALPSSPPGDRLLLDLTGLGTPTLTLSDAPGSGTWLVGAAGSVTYRSIEQVATTLPAAYHLVLDLALAGYADGHADRVQLARAASSDLVATVNDSEVFRGEAQGIASLSVLGSADDEDFLIEETAAGLLRPTGPAPPIQNAPLGGGTSQGSHLNATAEGWLDVAVGLPGVSPFDVGLHIDGGAGQNQLKLALTTPRDVIYTPDRLDSQASGNVGVVAAGGGPLGLLLSFARLHGLALQGTGGVLVVDASSVPGVTSLTVDAGQLPSDGWDKVRADRDLVPTDIRGFDSLIVRGGDGPQTLRLAGLDAASALTSVTLDGDNLANTDLSADTLRVESTVGRAASARLLGGRGHDQFELLPAPGGTLDAMAGPVWVSPTSGLGPVDDPAPTDQDTLRVSDLGDRTGDQVTMTERWIEGLTGYAGVPDIQYASIDRVDLAATAGHDLIDLVLAPGSDLDQVTVRGGAGDDTFFLDLDPADRTANAVPGLATVTLIGDEGNDSFGNRSIHAPLGPPPLPLPAADYPLLPFPTGSRGGIEPSTTTAIVIQGGPITTSSLSSRNATGGNVAGDTLNLDLTPSYADPASIGIVATVSGQVFTSGYKSVTFSDLEAIHVVDGGRLTRTAMGDLLVRGTEGPDTIVFSPGGTNLARTRVNSAIYNLPVTTRTIAYGRGGNDSLQQSGLDLPAELYGEAGDDYLVGYRRADLLVGGLGNDRLLGGEGDNELWGDDLGGQDDPLGGNDILSGGSGHERFYGGGGNDQIVAMGGNDWAYGGPGDDSLDGGDGDARLFGGEGSDTLSGGGGDDVLSGGGGNDSLMAGSGHDLLIGGLGADLLSGDAGHDLLIGGRVQLVAPPGQDQSRVAGDAHDQALLALLADWRADRRVNVVTLLAIDDGDGDDLQGGLDLDGAFVGVGDRGDWDITLP